MSFYFLVFLLLSSIRNIEALLLMEVPIVIKGLRNIADNYDVILFDQFGCIHNGDEPIPGSIEAIENLRKMGKKTYVVSNTSSRKQVSQDKYHKIGFKKNSMDGFVTSGERAHEFIGNNYAGRKALWFTWRNYREDDFLKSLGVTPVQEPEEADFICFHGSQTLAAEQITKAKRIELFKLGYDAMGQTINGMKDISLAGLFQTCAELKIPAICANPDQTAVRSDGNIRHMPGKLADRYDDVSSIPTLRFGKPDADHFTEAIDMAIAAGAPIPSGSTRPRVLHIGDSLHHDIEGAHAAGIDSLLITDHGVHKEDLAAVINGKASSESLVHAVCDLCDKQNTKRPTYILDTTKW